MTTTASISEHTVTMLRGHRLRYATRRADLPVAVVFRLDACPRNDR
jgi:hypothetical protein